MCFRIVGARRMARGLTAFIADTWRRGQLDGTRSVRERPAVMERRGPRFGAASDRRSGRGPLMSYESRAGGLIAMEKRVIRGTRVFWAAMHGPKKTAQRSGIRRAAIPVGGVGERGADAARQDRSGERKRRESRRSETWREHSSPRPAMCRCAGGRGGCFRGAGHRGVRRSPDLSLRFDRGFVAMRITMRRRACAIKRKSGRAGILGRPGGSLGKRPRRSVSPNQGMFWTSGGCRVSARTRRRVSRAGR